MKYNIGDLILGSGYYRQIYKIEGELYKCICADKFSKDVFLMNSGIDLLDRCNYPIDNNKEILKLLEEAKAEIL